MAPCWSRGSRGNIRAGKRNGTAGTALVGFTEPETGGLVTILASRHSGLFTPGSILRLQKPTPRRRDLLGLTSAAGCRSPCPFVCNKEQFPGETWPPWCVFAICALKVLAQCRQLSRGLQPVSNERIDSNEPRTCSTAHDWDFRGRRSRR